MNMDAVDKYHVGYVAYHNEANRLVTKAKRKSGYFSERLFGQEALQ